MSSSFQSIFSSNTELDPSLSELFSRKTKERPKPVIDTTTPTKTDDKKSTKISTRPKKPKKLNTETENRTIFVGNLHNSCKKEELIKLFKAYGKIDSVRFRNIVPEDITKTKKYAYITKQQHPNKTTINAFVRFKEAEAARKASEETNGLEFKSLHLRVDIAAKSKNHDNKRSIFLGGLPFDVTDEDVYGHFSSCGPIDYVRIIRDNKSGIGKGFGYVTFKTADTISLGLRLDGSQLNTRKIRVTRCVKKQKASKTEPQADAKSGKKNKFRNGNNKPMKKPKNNNSGKMEDVSDDKPKLKKKKTQTDKDAQLTSKKLKEKNRKKNKKRHVGTNNKNAIRFKI